MHARNLLVRFVLALLIVSDISSVFAAPPTPPSGFLAGWLFAQYFKNIVEGWWGTGTCPAWQGIVGFNTWSSSLYGIPVCQAVASSQWITNAGNIYYNVGNVGIGIDIPTYKLQVNWNIAAKISTNDSNSITLWNSTRNWNMYNLGWTDSASPNAFIIENCPIPGLCTRPITISVSNNIWIGTSSPASKLDIGGNVNNSVQATFTRAADSNFALQAINRSAVNVNGALVSSFWVYWWWLDSSSINFYRWGGAQDWKIALSTNATDRLFVENNGNVGIGTSSPWQKLSVAGTVESTTGWFKFPDGTIQTTASTAVSTLSWTSISWKPTSLAGYWITDALDLTSSQYPTGIKYFQWNKWSSSYLGANNTYPLEAFSNDWWAAAMSFHRAWAYAVNLWLDPDNVFRIWWWSAASNRWQLDMSWNNTIAGNFQAAGSPVPANWYNIQWWSVWVSTVYWYTRVCAQNSSWDCSAWWGVVMGAENTSAAISLWSNGNIYASNYYYKSDIRLKKDIKILSWALDKIRQLNWYSFNWKKMECLKLVLLLRR